MKIKLDYIVKESKYNYNLCWRLMTTSSSESELSLIKNNEVK